MVSQLYDEGELIAKVAQDCELSKAVAEKALNSVMAGITEAMAAGDKVTLIGFGAFSVVERAAREGRNPATGKKMKIAAKKVVKFKVGSKLAEAANK